VIVLKVASKDPIALRLRLHRRRRMSHTIRSMLGTGLWALTWLLLVLFVTALIVAQR
jgi:hypothetical protein